MAGPKKTFKMPTMQQFLNKKTLGEKTEAVWFYLEREMRQNREKPYNEKVGNWLRFLKDLKTYQHREGVKMYKKIQKGIGPVWYRELSSEQQRKLATLKDCIHQDLIEDLPVRTRQCLQDIGVTTKIQRKALLDAMKKSVEDPGIFIWNLFTAIYKHPPNILRGDYDLDGCILMSSLVFIDIEECIKMIAELTKSPKKKPKDKPPEKPPPKKPNVRYAEYLVKPHVTPYESASTKAAVKEREVPQPEPMEYKLRLRSQESYQRLCRDNTFLTKRIERNKKNKEVERVCNYKFWEPPSTLRNTDPKMAAIVDAMKTMKKRATPKHKTPYNNLQFAIGGVFFCKGSPHFIINAASIMPTGYVPINGGVVAIPNDGVLTNIHGYWKYPKDVKEACDEKCDCLAKWESVAMEHMKNTKCKCGHLYDFYNEGVCKEKYFYSPTKHGSFWFDHAKVFQMDPTEDYIKETLAEALRSVDATPQPSREAIEASGMQISELLAAFLADISGSPLMIPHLPQANLLNNLQEWVRKRMQGNLTEKQKRKLLLETQRKWAYLSHMKSRAIAYQIPFTMKQLQHMSWAHRKLIQDLFKELLSEFVTRTRSKILDQSRLWWSSMNYDAYPSKPFLDIFFTYMPGRMNDTYVINPYSSKLIPKDQARTCPLS